MTATITERPVPAQEYGPVTAVVSCEDCQQQWDVPDGPAHDIQTLAEDHTLSTGHVTRVTASQVITYRPAGSARGRAA